MQRYDLLSEGWIRCRTTRGSQELGLKDLLLAPKNVLYIEEPLPPVEAAIIRLLLAILHRALQGPGDEEQWKEWWSRGEWDTTAVDRYLENWRHRFDLFDRERPFYQAVGVDPDRKKTVASIAYEMASPANRAMLFDHTAPYAAKFTPAEAARRLVAFQAFSVGGLVSGVGQDKYSRAGPLAKSAVCIVRGSNLFETLMLNMVRYDPRTGKTYPFDSGGSSGLSESCDDLPAWERPEDPKPQERRPAGYVDYLTWQSRRVRLLDEDRDGLVELVVDMKGYQIPKYEDMYGYETMVPFEPVRNPGAKSSSAGRTAFFLREERALWRDSTALIDFRPRDEERRWDPPRNLEWLHSLVNRGMVTLPRVFPVEVCCQTTDQANVERWSRQVFPMWRILLELEDARAVLENIVYTAEKGYRHLRSVLMNALKGGDEKGRKKHLEVLEKFAGRVYWSSLEVPFYEALRELAGVERSATAEALNSIMKKWRIDTARAARQAFGQATPMMLACDSWLSIARAEMQLLRRLSELAKPEKTGGSRHGQGNQ